MDFNFAATVGFIRSAFEPGAILGIIIIIRALVHTYMLRMLLMIRDRVHTLCKPVSWPHTPLPTPAQAACTPPNRTPPPRPRKPPLVQSCWQQKNKKKPAPFLIRKPDQTDWKKRHTTWYWERNESKIRLASVFLRITLTRRTFEQEKGQSYCSKAILGILRFQKRPIFKRESRGLTYIWTVRLGNTRRKSVQPTKVPNSYFLMGT